MEFIQIIFRIIERSKTKDTSSPARDNRKSPGVSTPGGLA